MSVNAGVKDVIVVSGDCADFDVRGVIDASGSSSRTFLTICLEINNRELLVNGQVIFPLFTFSVHTSEIQLINSFIKN